MDKQFSFNKPLAVNSKIIRASSFSETSRSQKCTIQERYHSQNYDNVVSQCNSEEILDTQINRSSQSILSQKVNLFDDSWAKEKDDLPNVYEDITFPIEHLSLVNISKTKSKSILAPSKLKVDNNTSIKPISTNDNNLSLNETLSEPAFELTRLDSNENNKKHNKNNILTDESKCHNLKQTCNSMSNEENQLNVSKLKKRLRSLMKVNYKSKKQSNKYLLWIICFIILFLVIFFYLRVILSDKNLLDTLCDPQYKTKNIPEELRKSIHGQDNATNTLIKFFKEKDNQSGFDIVILIGGTGVGKSYTSEIIRNNLKETSNIIDVFPPLFNKETQTYSALSICKCNIIRLDNLKYDDIIDAVKMSRMLKERAKNYCILILAIFNPEETDYKLRKTADLDRFIFVVENKFQEANFQPNVISYIPLSNDALTKCITDLANYTQIELTDDDVNNIKQDLLTSNSGCKGAYAKVQVTGQTMKKSEL